MEGKNARSARSPVTAVTCWILIESKIRRVCLIREQGRTRVPETAKELIKTTMTEKKALTSELGMF
jgi:hypothetical protein